MVVNNDKTKKSTTASGAPAPEKSTKTKKKISVKGSSESVSARVEERIEGLAAKTNLTVLRRGAAAPFGGAEFSSPRRSTSPVHQRSHPRISGATASDKDRRAAALAEARKILAEEG